MEILDTLLHRRSIRSFTGGGIPRETVEALLVAGMSGPAGKGKKPWRFVVVEDAETISRLAQARDPKQKLFDTASLVIAVFGDPSIADTWVEDCSVAMTNMHLAADALGLGSCWVQARMRTAADGTPSGDYVGRILGAPGGLSLEAMLVVGAICEHPAPHTLADIDMSLVSWESF